MEIFWLSLTVVSFLICIYFFIVEGFMETYSYLVFPFMTIMMYAFRRTFRKRMEKGMHKPDNERDDIGS